MTKSVDSRPEGEHGEGGGQDEPAAGHTAR
jgi:hypothetical protein